ncbi:MAG: chorismate-binding protein [Flavobacteriaceae bacterium]
MVSFFSKLDEQYQNKLPFVAYKKPNDASVHTLFQKDDTVNYVTDFSESGFVFAPFDTTEQPILISFDHSFTTDYKCEKDLLSSVDIAFDVSAKTQHEALVSKAISEIEQTDLKKVVLSRVEQVEVTPISPIEVFEKALAEYPNAFVYLWYHPAVGCWLGATPEVLLQTRNNKFKTMALAGTQVFSENNTWGEKEQEEQQIVTNYIVDNLISEHITPEIGEPHTVKAGELAHIKTDITGRFNKSQLQQIIAVLHPTPAVCGMPKKEATQFIKQHEPYNRAFYTGFLGELNKTSQRRNNRRNTENTAYRLQSSTSDLYVNLRCMELNHSKANIYVGGGITASSDPEKEFIETYNKTKTMKKLIIS